MKKRILIYSICVLFGLSTSSICAQSDQYVDLDFIYNKWLLSISESSDDILIYRDEADAIFDVEPYDSASALKFTRRDNTIYLNYFPNKTVDRCGVGLRQKAAWAKGIWSLEEDKKNTFLVLEHFHKTKGSSYRSIEKNEFKVSYLDDNKMVLKSL